MHAGWIRCALLSAWVYARQTILSQSFITPSCGTGTLSLAHATRVLELTRDLSEKIRNEYGALSGMPHERRPCPGPQQPMPVTQTWNVSTQRTRARMQSSACCSGPVCLRLRASTPAAHPRPFDSDIDTGSLKDRVIVIDPGHGGPERGAIGVRGITEAEVNLTVGLHLWGLLKQAGARPVLTRFSDQALQYLARKLIWQRTLLCANRSALMTRPTCL